MATLISASRKGQLEHISHRVKASLEAKFQNFKHWPILKEMTKPAGPFGTMPQEPWHPEKGAKPDCIIQLNCGEVHTHAVLKPGNGGVQPRKKMILLSHELWLVSNNSNSFAMRSKSIIRSNLGLCKHSEIYLI